MPPSIGALPSDQAREYRLKRNRLAKNYYGPEQRALEKVQKHATRVEFPNGRAQNVLPSRGTVVAPGAIEDSGAASSSSASTIEQVAQRQCAGLCGITLSPEHYAAFKDAHKQILGWGNPGAGWNGDEEDTRIRKYGLLPGQRGRLKRTSKKFCMREVEHDDILSADDERRNWAATRDLECEDGSPLANAIDALCDQLKPSVEKKYQCVVCRAECIALQPNQHGDNYGRSIKSHLPLHCDMPEHDGFGVVIVTLAMEGEGQIVLIDHGDPPGPLAEDLTEASWTFRLRAANRQGYALCGNARNKMLHGVYVPPECESSRESLNVRFGLHGAGGNNAFSAYEEVDRHWLGDIVDTEPQSLPPPQPSSSSSSSSLPSSSSSSSSFQRRPIGYRAVQTDSDRQAAQQHS